jgi:hypothetical protein
MNAALGAFDDELHPLLSRSVEDVLGVVRRAVPAVNTMNEQHSRVGHLGYETARARTFAITSTPRSANPELT